MTRVAARMEVGVMAHALVSVAASRGGVAWRRGVAAGLDGQAAGRDRDDQRLIFRALPG